MLNDHLKNFGTYNAIDAAVMCHIQPEFWPEITNDADYKKTYDFTMQLSEPFLFMMKRGIRVDQENLSNMSKKIGSELAMKHQELCEEMGRQVPSTFINSSKQCQQYFYVELGIQPYYKDGKVSMDDKALTRIAKGTAARPPCRAAKLVQEMRGLNKLMSTYMEMEFDADNRFRCDVKLRGTRFGRVSTGKTIRDTGMNMQNLPQQFKVYLIPDEGHFFIELDKKQIEWIIVAYLARDPNMIKVHQEGMDAHVHTAHLMFKCDKELIVLDDKIVGNETDPYAVYELRKQEPFLFKVHGLPRNMSMRQAGKKSNHGLNYDEGYKGFAMINEMTEKEAKVIVDMYHAAYPGIRNTYYKMVQEEMAKDRTLTNCFGRKNKFLGKWDDQLFKAGYSFKPQSTCADLLNRGLIGSYYCDDTIFKPLELLAQVHDSVLEQYPIDKIEDAAKVVVKQKQLFDTELEYNGLKFHVDTDMKVGLKWTDMEKVKLIDNPVEQADLIRAALNELGQVS